MAENLRDTFEAFLDRVAGPLPDGEDISETAIEGRGPIVRDDHQADRMVRRMAHLEREIMERVRHIATRQAECEAFIQEQLEPDLQWQADEDAKAQRSLMALEGLLRSYTTYLRQMGKLGKAKGYTLPAGRLQFSDVSADFELVDEAAFTAWAKPLGLVEMAPKAKWIQAKHWFHPYNNLVGSAVYVEYLDDASGAWIHELVPGVRVKRPRGEAFRVQHKTHGEGERCEPQR